MSKVLSPTTNNPNLLEVQYFVKIKWDHTHDQTSIPYSWIIKWKDQTLFSFYQLFDIRVKDVCIYIYIYMIECKWDLEKLATLESV